ncbi:MAG: hypothetical protein NVSMB40_20060 [Aquirhabdus sp.]
MSSSPSLSNFGVPRIGGARIGMLMPKVKNRFRVTVSGFGPPAVNGAQIYFGQQVITVARPNVTFPPQAVHSYNSIAYYGGKAEWETIAVTVRDDISNSVNTLVSSQVQKQMNFSNQTVPVSASEYKFQMQIDTMDGSADGFLEQWFYDGCFLSAINYESFDYGSSDAMVIEMTIRFDLATQYTAGTAEALAYSRID